MPQPKQVLSERIERYTAPEPNTGCHLWIGVLTASGYGDIKVDGRSMRAHRVTYALAKGEIPAGLELDHLCRVRSCVNPDHLEAVPGRVNNLRSNSPSARNARATTCKRGHSFDESNTYLHRGSRYCKKCQRDAVILSRRRRGVPQRQFLKRPLVTCREDSQYGITLVNLARVAR